MKLSAPKQITFWISVVLAVIGVVAKLLGSGLGGWLVLVGFVVLAAGCLVDSL